jgi:hypothetical protein
MPPRVAPPHCNRPMFRLKAHPRSTFSFILDFQLSVDWLKVANVATPTPLSANGVKAESLI